MSDIERIELELQQLFARYAVPSLPRGLQHPDINVNRLMTMDTLVYTMTAYSLREKRTETYARTEHVRVPNWPRWMPHFLRRRWTTDKKVTARATIGWHYPEANIKVEKLGRAYPILLLADDQGLTSAREA